MAHTREHTHEHTSHSAPGMGHSTTNSTGSLQASSLHGGSAEQFLRRFWIVTFLLIPLVLVHPAVSAFLGLPPFAPSKWIQFALATAIFGFALVFFQHAWHEIRSRTYGMMTLVSLAVGSGYLFSLAATFIPALEAEFYLEIATLVWVLLFGHYLEARSSSAAGDALTEVAKLLPKKAHKLDGGAEVDVAVDELREGDTVIVKPGEKIPADGTVREGAANVDESLISGESTPVAKAAGAEAVAGAICLDGSLTIELSRVGAHSTIGQIQQLIAQASQSKPRSQRLADKAAGALTFIAGAAALATLLIWTLIIGESLVFSITLAITVLVIACPHALGLAIPTVTTITTSLAVKNGFFLKDLSKIEMIRKADYVVFDKTGTLTEGVFGVRDTVSFGEEDADTVLSIAASLEQHSSHIIGQSILQHARERDVSTIAIDNFQNIAGEGVQAQIDGQTYFAGNARLMSRAQHTVDPPENVVGTLVFIASEDAVLGYIVLADAIKASSHRAVRALHEMGVKVAMLTGDNERVARAVSDELGIDTYFADVLPEEKYTHIKTLQEAGNVVLMVGDGVNDAPALTQADAGVAIGAGTDVAVEAGDVVLTDNDPYDIVRLIILAKEVYRKMVQNLVWALGYNVVAIPAAAGAFAAWGIFLRPEVGALIMSLSTVIVVVNAMTLKRLSLERS